MLIRSLVCVIAFLAGAYADPCASATDVSVLVSVGSSVTIEESEAKLIEVSLTCAFPYDVIVDIIPAQGKVVTLPARFVVPSGSPSSTFPVWIEASDNAEVAAVGNSSGQDDDVVFAISGLQGNTSRVLAPTALSVYINDDDVAGILVASVSPVLMLEGRTALQDNQFISVGLTAAPSEDLRVILRSTSGLPSRTSVQTPNVLVFPAANRSSSQSWWLPQSAVLSALNDHINNMPGSLIYNEGLSAAVSNRTSAIDAVWAAMSASSAWNYPMPVGLNAPQSAPLHTKYIVDADAGFLKATGVPKFVLAGDSLSFDVAPAIWPAVPTLDFPTVTIVVDAGNTSSCIVPTGPQEFVFAPSGPLQTVRLMTTNASLTPNVTCSIAMSLQLVRGSTIGSTTVQIPVLNRATYVGSGKIVLGSTVSIVEGGSAAIPVSLDRAPNGVVAVRITAQQRNVTITTRAAALMGVPPTITMLEPLSYAASINGGVITPLPITLWFSATNYSTPVTITFATQNDNIIQLSAARNLLVQATSTSSDDSQFISVTSASGISVIDDDFGSVLLSKQSVTVNPAASAGSTYGVTLSAQPSFAVTVSFSLSSNASLLVFDPASLTFTATNWNASRVVTVTTASGASISALTSVQITHVVRSADVLFNASEAAFPSSHVLLVTVLPSTANTSTPLDTSLAPVVVSVTLAESAHEVRVLFDKGTTLGTGFVGVTFPSQSVLCSATGIFSASTIWTLDGGDVLPALDPHAGVGTGSGSPPRANASTCYWSNASILVIQYSAANQRWLSNGDVLEFAPGVLRATSNSVNFVSGSIAITGRLPLPIPVAAAFTASGNGLTITFSSATAKSIGNRQTTTVSPSTLACDSVLNVSVLGVGSACSWTSDTVLNVRLGSGSTLVPATPFPASPASIVGALGWTPGLGSPPYAQQADCTSAGYLAILPGSVRAAYNSVRYAPVSFCLAVNVPANPPKSSAAVTGSTLLGSCDDMSLDASLSQTVAGRANSFIWGITAGNDFAAACIQNITTYLTQDFSRLTSATFKVPSALMLPGASFVVNVSVRNMFYLNDVTTPPGTASLAVSIASQALPRVAIDGPSELLVSASAPLTLRVKGALPTCGNATSASANRRLIYTWSVAPVIQTSLASVGFSATNLTVNVTSFNARYTTASGVIKLPALTLQLGVQYTIKATVSVVDAATNVPLNATNDASVVVNVAPLGLTAAIAGGDREVGSQSTFTLDASGSADLDNFPSLAFSYSWSCWNISGASSQLSSLDVTALQASVLSGMFNPCTRVSNGQPLTNLAQFQRSASTKLTLVGNELQAGTYAFVVNASKGFVGQAVPQHFRWATAASTLTVKPGSPPDVYCAIAVSGLIFTGSATVSPKDTVRLVGFVNYTRTATSTILYKWETLGTATSMSVLVGDVTSTSVGFDVTQLQPLASVTIRLTGTIMVNGVAVPGGSSSSTLILTRAGPPFGGVLAASPLSGTAAVTKFSFSADSWLPSSAQTGASSTVTASLEYLFYYMMGDPTRLSLFKDATTGVVRDFTMDDFSSGKLTVKPLSSTFSTSTKLEAICPRGLASANSTLTIVVVVRDPVSGALATSFLGRNGLPVTIQVSAPAETVSGMVSFVSSAVSGGSGNSSLASSLGSDKDSILASATALGSLVRASSLGSVAVKSACAAAGLDCAANGECIPAQPPTYPTARCSCSNGYSGPTCDIAPIPVDGNYSSWSAWRSCSLSCGGGTQFRTRTCTASAYNGVPSACEAYATAVASGSGVAEPPTLVETRACNTQDCPLIPVDSGYGAWTEWSACNSSCKTLSGFFPGMQERSRVCDSPAPSALGLSCDRNPALGPALERRVCNTEYCTGSVKICPGSSTALSPDPNPYKIPAFECSGNGACVRDPPSCSDGQPNCVAMCVCAGSFTGSACAFTAHDLEASQNATKALISVIASTTADSGSDLDSDAVEATAAALTSLIVSPDDVGSDGTSAAADILDALLSSSEGSGGGTTAAQGTDLSTTAATNMLSVISVLNEAQNQEKWLSLSSGSADNSTTDSGVDALAVRAALASTRNTNPGSAPVVLSSNDGSVEITATKTSGGSSSTTASSVTFPGGFFEDSSASDDSNATSSGDLLSDLLSSSSTKPSSSIVVSDWSGTPPHVGSLMGADDSTSGGAGGRRLASAFAARMSRIQQTGRQLCLSTPHLRLLGCPGDSSDQGEDSSYLRRQLTVSQDGLDTSEVRSASGVRTIDVSLPSGSNEIRGLAVPITFDVVISRDLSPDPDKMGCSYFNEASGMWSDEGVIAAGFRVDEATGALLLTCATTHLSAFTSHVSPYEPTYNKIDPIADAGLLKNYLDPSNVFPLIILGVIACAFVLAWAIGMLVDLRNRKAMAVLREEHMIRFGHVERGLGNDAIAAAEPAKAKEGTNKLEQTVKDAENSLADTKQRGTMFLATMYVWTHWMDGLRRSHSWISVFFPPKDEQLAMSRPQRIVTLLSVILAGMASNAVFFGYDPDNVGAKILFGMISVVIMLPVEELFPRLFRAANTFDSKTVKERNVRKKVIAKKRRASQAGQRRWSIIRAMKKAPATVVGRRSSNIAPLPVAEGQTLRRASVVSQSDDISMHIGGASDNNHGASNSNDNDLLATMTMARKHRRSSAFQRAVEIPTTSSYQPEQRLPSRRASVAGQADTPTEQPDVQAPVSTSDASAVQPGIHIPSRRASAAWAGQLEATSTSGMTSSSGLQPGLHLRSRRASVSASDGVILAPTSQQQPPASESQNGIAVNIEEGGVEPGAMPADLDGTNAPVARRRSIIASRRTSNGQIPPLMEADAPVLVRAFSEGQITLRDEAVERAAQDSARVRAAEVVLGSIELPRDPDGKMSVKVWNIFGIIAVMQACTGAASVMASIYIVANEQATISALTGATVAITFLVGFFMMGFGAAAHRATRHFHVGWSIVTLFMALGLEALGAFLLYWFQLPYQRTLWIGIGVVQLLPALLASIVFAVLEIAKARLASKLDAMHTTKTLAVIMDPTPAELRSILRLQAAVRGFLGRSHARRIVEVQAWNKASPERKFLLLVVYFAAFTVCGILLYTCLLYGVKFEQRQTQAWVVSTLIGFATDILVQQPAMELLKVFVALLVMLCKNSVRSTVIQSLAARRDHLRLLLREARAQEEKAADSQGSNAALANLAVTKAAVEAQVRHVGIADVLSDWKGRRTKF